MAVMLVVVALGAIAGRIAGGRLSNLGRWRPVGWAVLVAVVLAQFALGHLPVALRGAVATAGCVAVVGWCWANRRQVRTAGAGLLGAGAVLNAIVVAANGAMPVSRRALSAAGFPPGTDVARGHLYKHVLMTPGSHLSWLGDVIPLRPADMVMSPGDVLMLAGIAGIVFFATRGDTRRSFLRPETVAAA